MKNLKEQSSKEALNLKFSACGILAIIWRKIVYDLFSWTFETLVMIQNGYNELIEEFFLMT